MQREEKRDRSRAPRQKRGGAGKGNWGKLGDEMSYYDTVDPGDPNYDSEEESGVLYSTDVGEVVKHYGTAKKKDFVPASRRTQAPPAMTLAEFKVQIIKVLGEYFISNDAEEVARCLNEIDAPAFHFEFVKRTVTMAMDKPVRGRECASRLLSSLYGTQVITMDELQKGFLRLFEVADDLQIDIPDANKIIAQFLARAVVDEILPPKFLSDPLVASTGGDIVEQARTWLSRSHGIVRLGRVWGPGDGRPVPDLKNDIRLLLQEYIMTNDLPEAARCIKDLSTPMFHHEVVKRALVFAIDAPAAGQSAISSLLAHLASEEIVSQDQMANGFERVYQSLADLTLDTPKAPQMLHGLMQQAMRDNVLPPGYAKTKALAAAASRAGRGT